MKYGHILNYVAATPWAIESSKMQDILSVLAFRAAGHEFSPDEIRARIGAADGTGGSAVTQGALAVIPVRGVIAHRMGSMDDSSGGTSCERIGAMLDRAASDASVSTILYDFETPGGTVPGVMELASKMFELRGTKRQVAMVNGMAASAGYWLAAQCDEIVCTPSGSSGSIGVFSVVQNLSAALEQQGIKVEVIKAGKYKAEGNPFEPLSEEGRAFIQARVDEAYAQFVKDVARGRAVSVSDVRSGYGEGRTLTAKDAKAAGLIDRIATMDETIGRLVGRKSPGGLRADADAARLRLV